MLSIKKLLITSLLFSKIIFTTEIEQPATNATENTITIEQLEQEYANILNTNLTKQEALQKLSTLKGKVNKLLYNSSLFPKILALIPTFFIIPVSANLASDIENKNDKLNQIIRAASNEINKREPYLNTDLQDLNNFERKYGINYRTLKNKYDCSSILITNHNCDKACNYERLQKYIESELKSSLVPYGIAALSSGILAGYIIYTISNTYNQNTHLNLLLENIENLEKFILETNIH